MDLRREQHLSSSVAETEALAAKLACGLSGGVCVALYGDLGAGKTQFVRGLVRGFGGDARVVSSPTFVLLNVYDASKDSPQRLTVYHLDAYRVNGPGDFEGIGFAELLEEGGIVVVEWADRVETLLPRDRIEVRIEPVDQETRRIQITQPG